MEERKTENRTEQSGGNNRSNDRRPRRRDGKRRFFRKKVCFICSKKLEDQIDYKNVDLLRRFTTDRGKILPRRITGTCAKHQRSISREIRRARIIALLPFEDK